PTRVADRPWRVQRGGQSSTRLPATSRTNGRGDERTADLPPRRYGSRALFRSGRFEWNPMVRVPPRPVHAESPAGVGDAQLCARRPVGGLVGALNEAGDRTANSQSAARTCAHTTIMLRKSVMDASVAASSTTARNMTQPQDATEHRENIVHLLFQSQALLAG